MLGMGLLWGSACLTIVLLIEELSLPILRSFCEAVATHLHTSVRKSTSLSSHPEDSSSWDRNRCLGEDGFYPTAAQLPTETPIMA